MVGHSFICFWMRSVDEEGTPKPSDFSKLGRSQVRLHTGTPNEDTSTSTTTAYILRNAKTFFHKDDDIPMSRIHFFDSTTNDHKHPT